MARHVAGRATWRCVAIALRNGRDTGDEHGKRGLRTVHRFGEFGSATRKACGRSRKPAMRGTGRADRSRQVRSPEPPRLGPLYESVQVTCPVRAAHEAPRGRILRNGAGRSADAGGMFATITLPSRHSRAGGPQRQCKEHSWEYRQAAVAWCALSASISTGPPRTDEAHDVVAHCVKTASRGARRSATRPHRRKGMFPASGIRLGRQIGGNP